MINWLVAFREFIVANPQCFSLVRDRFNRTGIFAPSNRRISKWFKVALISNMPKLFFEIFSVMMFTYSSILVFFHWNFHFRKTSSRNIWKINFLIDNSENEGIHEQYRLYNRVRYGPEDPNLFVEIFRPSYGPHRSTGTWIMLLVASILTRWIYFPNYCPIHAIISRNIRTCWRSFLII